MVDLFGFRHAESPARWYRESPWYVQAFYSWGFLLVVVMALTGCGQPRVQLVLPPANLATCAAEPLAPELPGREEQARRDALTLSYILGLRTAWGDCSSKVAGLKAWIDTARE